MTPTDRTDLLAFVQALHRQVAQFRDPPPSTEDVTALRDAWNAILRPRIGRMERRLERWSDASRWIFVDGEEYPVGTPAGRVDRVHARHGQPRHRAARRLEAVRHREAEAEGDAVRPRLHAHGHAPSRRWPIPGRRLYGGVMDRQTRRARGSGAGTPDSYWHLLGRFRYAWDWSYLRRQQWNQYWRKRQQATDKLFEDLRSELNGTRDTLGETLLGVQAFVAALQNAEEERLQEECIPCKTKDETLVKMADTALEGMQVRRVSTARATRAVPRPDTARSSASGSVPRRPPSKVLKHRHRGRGGRRRPTRTRSPRPTTTRAAAHARPVRPQQAEQLEVLEHAVLAHVLVQASLVAQPDLREHATRRRDCARGGGRRCDADPWPSKPCSTTARAASVA